MLLTISTAYQPATDLGYLLHKNPGRLQSEELSFGRAHVFYPEADAEACTVALLVEVDPVALVRRSGPAGEGAQLQQYVNDRPYVANSFLSVAMGRLFASAMGGRSKERAELAETAIPLTAHLPVLAARGGHDLVRRLFEPLGYVVGIVGSDLEPSFPEWGASPYVGLTLTGVVRLQDLLTHLYVLIPVLDNEKHYWVGNDELEKLLRRGDTWLPSHPEKQLIVSRYLKRARYLTREALQRLLVEEPDGALEEGDELAANGNAMPEEPALPLHQQRLQAVLAVLKSSGAKRVLDLGCGDGKLLRLLQGDPQFEQIAGMDVAYRSLEIARERLHLERMTESQRARIQLIQGSLTYRDARLANFEAAAVVEVIEHLEPARLAAFERVLFEFAAPGLIALTTPNAEYNALFPTLPAGELRHADHRFEWTRLEFQTWAEATAARYGYAVRFEAIGPEDAGLGSPSQMAVFTRCCTNGTQSPELIPS
jgi:3' terminal RNA ribose 2'-O-methyltransferase Hen1